MSCAAQCDARKKCQKTISSLSKMQLLTKKTLSTLDRAINYTMKRQLESTTRNIHTKASLNECDDESPPKKRRKLDQQMNKSKQQTIDNANVKHSAELSSSILLSTRKYQKQPIIYVNGGFQRSSNNNDNSSKELKSRPLMFGEPILDTLGIYSKHETFVQLRQFPIERKSQNNNKTNDPKSKSSNEIESNYIKIIISKHNKSTSDEKSDKTSKSRKSSIQSQFDSGGNRQNQSSVSQTEHLKNYISILGHSVYSPTRGLKQILLNQNESKSIETNSNEMKRKDDNDLNEFETHSKFVSILDKNVHYNWNNIGYPKLASVMILMDCNSNIFLTQRQKQLRSFPLCWVFPGGSIDPNGVSPCFCFVF